MVHIACLVQNPELSDHCFSSSSSPDKATLTQQKHIHFQKEISVLPSIANCTRPSIKFPDRLSAKAVQIPTRGRLILIS